MLNVYVAKAPPVWSQGPIIPMRPAVAGELQSIIDENGNGWRKLFSVYAKVVFALASWGLDLTQGQACWQDYQRQRLLQTGSDTALYFGRVVNQPGRIQVIAGRQHARMLEKDWGLNLQWLDQAFALCRANRVVVCPFFDYRQLTNEKIARLAALIIKSASP